MPIVLTADKVIDVLEAVAASGSGIGTRPLARKLDLNVATVHNIAKTLEARGYLRQDPVHRRFQTGLRLMLLGRHDRYLEQLTTLGSPRVRKLAADLEESVMLGAVDHGRIINLIYVPSSQALRVQEPDDLGSLAYCTAMGKLMLAAMPARTLDAYLEDTPLRGFTPHTITSRPQLLGELDRIRRRGFSSTRDELADGVSAVAVGIKDPWGSVVAAIAASAPTIRMDRPAQQQQTLDALRAAAQDLMTAWSGVPTAEERTS